MRQQQSLLLLLPLLLVLLPAFTNAHNITRILAAHPEFSTFNHYLTVTRLANEINRRLTITVLALDNAAMASILAHHYTLPTLKNVLSLHLLDDYYGAKKLHQLTGGTALASSFFQATGSAPGTTGYVNITDHTRGHVTFSAVYDASDSVPSPTSAAFVKSVKEMPYNISIVQISDALSSPAAEAPAAAPAPVNLTSVLSKNGCKAFASLLLSVPDVLAAYKSNLDGGLTVFCPVDAAVNSFMPKYKNLTAEGKTSLLLYQGSPVYNSMQMLRQGNGVATTLATEGGPKKSYHIIVQDTGDTVTLETKVVTATILKTVLDRDPVAIFSINKVLQPRELFKTPEADAPAPAADAPAGAGKKKKKKAPVADAPSDVADGPDGAPADEKAADQNAAAGKGGLAAAVAAVVVAIAAVIV